MNNPYTITRKSPWFVKSPDGVEIDQHNEFKEADETAVNWCLKHPRQTAKIHGPTYEAVYNPGENPEPPVSPTPPEPEPPPPIDFPEGDRVIKPGPGWAEPLPTPVQIGGVKEKSIAQWNVVRDQKVGELFYPGVIAHHVDGIDHVRIAVDGGDWVQIDQPSINPRTGSEEYWVELRPGSKTGWMRLRAIVTPIQGVQTNLTLDLHAGDDTNLFPVLRLGPDTYQAQDLLGKLPAVSRGWATIRPEPGVPRSEVVIKGTAGAKGRHTRFKDVTREMGRWDEHNSRLDGNTWWWFDETRIQGNGKTRWIVNEGGRQFYTFSQIDNVNRCFYSANLLANNVLIERCWEDVCNAVGMMANVSIERLDRGQYTAKHPDTFQWAVPNGIGGMIAQDVTSPQNYGQGLFTGPIRNSAFVRVNLAAPDNSRGFFYYMLQMLAHTENVLIKECNLNPAILRPDVRFTADRLVFIDSTVPKNSGLPGVEVRP